MSARQLRPQDFDAPRPLDAVWELTLRSDQACHHCGSRAGKARADELWGHCASCYYADDCRAGCSWTAHTTLGRRGNYPFCYHRVTELAKRGIRERIVPVSNAPGEPFDFGRFEWVEECENLS